jgi:cytochrome c peroxidase
VTTALRRLLLWWLALIAGAAQAAALDAAERQRVLAHGPWPPPAALDPGNRVAGRPAAVALGRLLFFDARLSIDGRLACASCHPPAQAFADGRARGQGREALARNTPSLWNAVHQRWWGWDGAADSLWSQARQPLLDRREMAGDPAHLRRLIERDADLSCRWRQVFGMPPPDDDIALLVQTGKALGAFVGSLVSGRTAFDRYRDALARDDRRAQARYPAAARRGLQLFVGRGRCHLCHAGPLFSNGEFADIGARFFVRPGVVDAGRHAGIAALRAGATNLLSEHADAPGDAALKTRHVQLQHRNFGEFKVPSLRNVALTAPYLHDGQLATLQDVLRHYSELDLERLHADGERILQPLHFSAAELRDLLAFLHSLSDPGARAWRAPPLPRCKG